MLLFIYLLGFPFAAALWSYMAGRARTRFLNEESDDIPPYWLGVITSFMWPAQLFAGLVFLSIFYSYRKGGDRGLAVNEELDELRQFKQGVDNETAKTLQYLFDHGIDKPESIDQQTTRALMARSIEFAMEEDQKARNHRADEVVPLTKEPAYTSKTEGLFDILDRAGHKVPDAFYRHNKGELDL